MDDLQPRLGVLCDLKHVRKVGQVDAHSTKIDSIVYVNAIMLIALYTYQ